MRPVEHWIDLPPDDLSVRKQVQKVSEALGLWWRDGLRLLVALAFHNPPDLSWLVIQALERTGSPPPDETGAGASRCTQQM